jgi:hypothetical protein
MTAVTPGTAAAATMTAVVQDEYGTAPEAVLRLAEIARPAIAASRSPARRQTWRRPKQVHPASAGKVLAGV